MSKKFIAPILAVAAVSGLAGCEIKLAPVDTVSLDNTAEPASDPVNPLYFGTQSGEASATGIAFASAEEVFDLARDGLESGGTVRVVAVERDEAGNARLRITDETLTVTLPETEGDRRLVVTLTDPNGLRSSENMSEDNYIFVDQGYRFASEDGRPSVATVFFQDETTAGFAVFGAETNPDELVPSLGTVNYEAPLRLTGAVVDGGGLESRLRAGGFISLDADFAQSSVTGEMELFLPVDLPLEQMELPMMRPEGTLTVALEEADILGNGFGTTANTVVSSVDGATFTSDSNVGGVFYGQDAETVAGVVGLDITATNDETGETQQFIGAGSFVSGDEFGMLRR
ncbi:transferrin-binding protein-like solute binding protein [Yoonia sediminilitoris]|uniref:Transferrin-binding protein B C-lobe/N-lobe beta-barrel domain-containing protein n=1 Tax=Yoonia sediminilitoris TaxID=1286148 RepID=A0A2T6K917_9RHOB|nr:transferrin-binding protein-like solute binding protein [Yoonia sediminilitoris]PUB11262.1 hypothetical protein C8N45_11434 [Yoonia sediminilitoris]RCW91078.1 hypothetical protein DFP92_11434 [Yoonia sediminilitoris]